MTSDAIKAETKMCLMSLWITQKLDFVQSQHTTLYIKGTIDHVFVNISILPRYKCEEEEVVMPLNGFSQLNGEM